jgi:zinc D-Ala-D-Ala carboxypeptidase
MTQLSPHFSLEELTASDTAMRLGINNDLPLELLAPAKATAEMLEAIRSYLSDLAAKPVPILISSGYRCLALNTAVGSKPTSDHVVACAADFTAPSFGTPLQICQALVPVLNKMGIGQVIYEHTWVHCSTRLPEKSLNRILTVQGQSYQIGIVG